MSQAELRLLVTSAGRRVELIEAFRDSARQLGITLEVFACDQASAQSAACQSADAAFDVPPANSADYIPALLDAARDRGIDLIVPTIDPELSPLARARAAFAAVGAEIAISTPELVAMAGDKLATAAFLLAHDIPSPRTATREGILRNPANWTAPFFSKPRFGSAGRNTGEVASLAALADLRTGEPMLVQTLLRGTEFTVNLFFDTAGRMLTAVPHERLGVRAGEVEKGVTRRLPKLIELAERLAAVLSGPRGAMCFQAMVAPGGEALVFEINARFGGGYPLAHRAGATFTRWLLEERLGRQPSALGNWQEGMTMLRYDAAVFVAR